MKNKSHPLKKENRKRQKQPIKITKPNWCQCSHPRFNGDSLDPKCTTCGGEIE